MSNVIQFLEAMGSNPALARLSVADYEAAIASLDADGAQRRALLDRDPVALNGLLGGRQERMMMSQYAPLEEPLKKDDEHHEGDEPSQDPTPDSDQAQ